MLPLLVNLFRNGHHASVRALFLMVIFLWKCRGDISTLSSYLTERPIL